MKPILTVATLCALSAGCNPSSTPPSSSQQIAKPKVNLTQPAPINKHSRAAWGPLLLENTAPLSNVPTILSTISTGVDFRVTLRNDGDTIIQYYSEGDARIQLFQEIFQLGKWKPGHWDWCGTGKEQFEISPGKTVELVVDFWDTDHRERMLADFSEKDTNRAGLVILATE